METFFEILNDRNPGEFNINYVGGPETFPPGEIFEAVRSGVIDVAHVTGVYYGGSVPMAKSMVLPEMTPWEMRKNGIHDFFDKIHQRHGVKYLGRSYSGISYKCYLNKKISNPEDMKGLSIRTSPVYRPMLKHFGANPVTTPPGEVYTALDRGVVDGFCWPEAGVVNFGWHELVKYVVNPGFMQVEVSLIMNQGAWDRLSSEQQQKLTEAVRIMERQDHFWHKWKAAQDKIVYQKVGLQTIELEGDAKDRYINAAYNEYWKTLRQQGNPEDVDELQSLLKKAGSTIPLGN